MSQPLSNTFKSTCSYCGVGCGIVVTQERDGKIRVEGDKENPVNKGALCSKGMNLHYTVMDKSDRLLYPEMRMAKHLPRQRVTWDEGLNRATAVFKTLIEKYGPDSVAFYVSGQCLTEEYYVINKLIKGFIGSNNIDTNSRLCMSSAVVGYKLSLGEDSVPCSYEDIELADCFFVTGANPAWCHPILWRRVEAHKQANPDVKLIVVDPRKTQTCAYADLHLQITPGTDVTLYHAIGRLLIEGEYVDQEFITNHSNGFEAYKELVFQKTLKESAQICGVKAEDIRWAATYIGEAKGFISMWAMGLNQSVIGVNKNLSLINLNLITGKIGKPGNGPFSLTGQPNAMGGREVGGLANLLPAHRNLADPMHRAEVEKFWGGGKIAEKPGLTATEMFEQLETGKLKAIWVVCTNPLVSLPDARQAERALAKAKFVVVQEISSRADTVKYADLVLPAAAWAEKEGTMTNSERRISYLHPVVAPPGEARPDAEIILDFAKRMGYKGFDYKNLSEIYDEYCQITKGTNIDITGLNYNILKEKGSVQWPYPTGHTGGGLPRLFTDHKFYTPNQKANISACPDANESEAVTPDFPLILTTGRIRDQWHTMTKTGKVNKLNQHIPIAFLEIHPKDAEMRGIENGDLVEISNIRGVVRVKAQVTTDIKKGVVFLPMHWGKVLNSDLNRANNLTNNLVDPRSKEPDFKFSAVQVVKFKKPRQKVCIVGAGAGAHGFVRSYRALNQEDEIVVFGKENLPFYNRVMLPDYVSGHQVWDQLVKMQEEEEKSLNITFYRGVSIEHIDRKNKILVDSNGNEHSYDVLLLATGSRANIPKDIPKLKGITTMRSRMDADRFRASLNNDSHVVVIGGGLLGLEMAASLRELDKKVTVVQRISRLMDRQMDVLGGQLLHQELTDKGIEIIYNDELLSFHGNEVLEGISLKSGRKISCDNLIFAIGTIPNIEIARSAELECKRGVVINEYLQTSDPNIYAIGEMAEFKSVIYGITAAAEQQAGILAKYLNGDISSYYSGSLFMNILKVEGLQICSLGMVEAPVDDPSYEEVVFIDKAQRYYKKCIIQNDRLVGAILMGDKSEFAEFKELIQNKIELSDKRLQLLRSGKKAEPVLGKLVCSCNNVGEGNIVSKIKAGCEDFTELCSQTSAGMGCGSCRPEVKAILERTVMC